MQIRQDNRLQFLGVLIRNTLKFGVNSFFDLLISLGNFNLAAQFTMYNETF